MNKFLFLNIVFVITNKGKYANLTIKNAGRYDISQIQSNEIIFDEIFSKSTILLLFHGKKKFKNPIFFKNVISKFMYYFLVFSSTSDGFLWK